MLAIATLDKVEETIGDSLWGELQSGNAKPRMMRCAKKRHFEHKNAVEIKLFKPLCNLYTAGQREGLWGEQSLTKGSN